MERMNRNNETVEILQTNKAAEPEQGELDTRHKIKIAGSVFEDVRDGVKPFELLKNDRDYKIGQIILFRHMYLRRNRKCRLCCIQGIREIKLVFQNWGKQ